MHRDWRTVVVSLGLLALLSVALVLTIPVYGQEPGPSSTEQNRNPTAAVSSTAIIPQTAPDDTEPSPTPTSTDENTPTPTPSPTPSATPSPTAYEMKLPLIIREPTPTIAPQSNLLVCRNPYLGIPDDNPGGVSDSMVINDGRWVQDLNIRLDISHSWVGDLEVNLTHVQSGTKINLLNRPGNDCSWNNVKAIFDDESVLQGNSQCVRNDEFPYPPAIGGIFKPPQPLTDLDQLPVGGEWRLTVIDHARNDTGTLRGWCIYTQVGSPLLPTPPPPGVELPSSAYVSRAVTAMQSRNLDCESRVAVDYAAFFRIYIGELDFYNHLPHSDNPDKGFVGNVDGTWGQIPPDDYGVHAEPVAALLREYGVSAYAHRKMSWDTLRAEIAAGKPVFVWDVGSVVNGWPTYYTPSDGEHTIVANYEHVVQVVGYDIPRNLVYILDNGSAYTRTIAQFLRSWSALDNMAIISHP